MSEHIVTTVDELNPGERITIQIEGREITVFNVEGTYRAYTNWCPHQSGPVCEGQLSGTWEADLDEEKKINFEWGREDEILNCPWHGWEYDVETGKCLSREGIKLPQHEVTVTDGDVVVTL